MLFSGCFNLWLSSIEKGFPGDIISRKFSQRYNICEPRVSMYNHFGDTRLALNLVKGFYITDDIEDRRKDYLTVVVSSKEDCKYFPAWEHPEKFGLGKPFLYSHPFILSAYIHYWKKVFQKQQLLLNQHLRGLFNS